MAKEETKDKEVQGDSPSAVTEGEKPVTAETAPTPPKSAKELEREYQPKKIEIALQSVDNGYVAYFAFPDPYGQQAVESKVMLDKEGARLQLLAFIDKAIEKIVDRPEVD